MVGSRFVKAVGLANEWHVGQVRKGTNVPYVAHLLGVASLVLEAGGDETMATAAILHDAIEDAGVTRARIEQEFGPRVAEIVEACSDGTAGKKRGPENWKQRKEDYLESLREEKGKDHDIFVVSCADKLHNARAIRLDLERYEEKLWERFNQRDPAEQRWYYTSLVEVFRDKLGDHWLAKELERTVGEIFPQE